MKPIDIQHPEKKVNKKEEEIEQKIVQEPKK